MAEQPQAQNAEKLLNDLQHSKEAYVRKISAEQLGEQAVTDEAVIGALKTAAQSDENKYVRKAAFNSLVKIGVEIPHLDVSPQEVSIEEKPLTNWRAFGIGVKISVLTLGLFFLVLAPVGGGIFGIVFAVFFSMLGIPLCIAGALLGKYLGGKSNAAWIGGIIASTLASTISIYLVFTTCWGMC